MLVHLYATRTCNNNVNNNNNNNFAHDPQRNGRIFVVSVQFFYQTIQLILYERNISQMFTMCNP